MPWADAVQHELEANPQYNKLLRAFRLFDKNGDGFMDAAELRDLLQRVNPSADPTKGDGRLTVEDAQTLISSFDDNGDGKLSIEELCAAWAVIGGADEGAFPIGNRRTTVECLSDAPLGSRTWTRKDFLPHKTKIFLKLLSFIYFKISSLELIIFS